MPDTWDYANNRLNGEDPRPPLPVMTYIIAALSIIITLANQTAADARPGTFWYEIGRFGHLPPDQIWDGHVGALLTSVFVHGNPGNLSLTLMHIGFNLLWLVRLGPVLERTLHPVLFLLFFIASAVVSSCAELAFSSATGVGASGVVYAMFGLLWAGRGRHASWRPVATRENFNLFLIWGIFCIVATWSKSMHVANAAHFGGFLFGLAVGWLFVGRNQKALGAVSLAGLTLVVLLSLYWMPWSPEWTFWKASSEAKKGRMDSAIGWLKLSGKLGADTALIWHDIGVLEARRGNKAGAAEAARQEDIANHFEPGDPDGPGSPDGPGEDPGIDRSSSPTSTSGGD
jgi:membrane associated rhomboid family serine protease